MTPVLTLLAAALAVDPPQPPVRVLEATGTRLALEIRPMTPLADGPGAAPPPMRTIVFTRSADGAPWAVASGLANTEVFGEANLEFPPAAGSVTIARMDAAIGAVAGTGVTAIDLIEGDVALCVWEGGAVRSIFFADELIPAAAAVQRAGGAKNALLALSIARRPDRAPIARGAIIAAQSRTPVIAGLGRARAAHATTVSAGVRVKADLDACAAVLDYAQPAIEPKVDSQYLLYFGLARLLGGSDRTPSGTD